MLIAFTVIAFPGAEHIRVELKKTGELYFVMDKGASIGSFTQYRTAAHVYSSKVAEYLSPDL